jgi:hyaluronoglucosaminidase
VQTDTKVRAGVIEGFFGKPWDWSARLSGIDFLHDNGYQFYIYAPKADPFLRRRWREPMPRETLQQLSKLGARCRERGISLGVGLTPFEMYLNYDATAEMLLRSKVLQINEIGADVLCILFDDMRGDIDGLAPLQARIIADICAWSSALRFIVCPTYYSYDPQLAHHFGAPPSTYLRDLGRSVDPSIDIFWTGEHVISEAYRAPHLIDVAAEIGRKPFIWDNHISNDSKIRTNYLFLDPSTNSWELPGDMVAGLAINPMNQAHLSRIALRAYQHLLAEPSAHRQVLLDACQDLCGSPFAERLVTDSHLLQKTGLGVLDTDSRRGLLNRYETQRSNPYAQEITAWLRGEYTFDPLCLTT